MWAWLHFFCLFELKRRPYVAFQPMIAYTVFQPNLVLLPAHDFVRMQHFCREAWMCWGCFSSIAFLSSGLCVVLLSSGLCIGSKCFWDMSLDTVNGRNKPQGCFIGATASGILFSAGGPLRRTLLCCFWQGGSSRCFVYLSTASLLDIKRGNEVLFELTTGSGIMWIGLCGGCWP